MQRCFRCEERIEKPQHFDYMCPTEPLCSVCYDGRWSEPARAEAKLKAVKRMVEAEPFDWVEEDIIGFEAREGHVYHVRPGDMITDGRYKYRIVENITRDDHRVWLHFYSGRNKNVSVAYSIGTNLGSILKRLLPGDEGTSSNY